MEAKMTATGNSKLLLLMCSMLMLLPSGLLAEGGDKRVALIPLWGEAGGIAQQFNEELYVALSAMDGFQPVFIDMTDLPPDIPVGGFPPSVSPHPWLFGNAGFAITGSVFIDPFSGLRTLRLYLWQASDYRPLFIDEMVATNRETAGMFLPIMLRWLFSWIPPEEVPSVVVETVIVVEEVEVEVTRTVIREQQVIVYRDMGTEVPNRWLYFGLRAGGNVQVFDPPLPLLYTAAAHIHFQFLRLNPSLFLGMQVEAIAKFDDTGIDSLSLALCPLRFTIRRGTSSFSLMGGVHTPIPQSDSQMEFLEVLGFTAGFVMGNRVGPGNLFMEIRLSNNDITSSEGFFRRGVIGVSLGYEFGLFNRRSRRGVDNEVEP